MSRCCLPRSSAGFTLLELLIVLVIGVMVIGLVAPRFAALVPGVELKGETQKLAALLRYSRSRALAEGREIRLQLVDEPLGLQITGREQLYRWPASYQLHMEPISEDDPVISEELPAFRFYPDGSASGGEITLGSAGQRYRINVEWLTGKVVIDED
ncbi:GspH/FimT family pseudopilin [Marinobacterium arenosum]|uniref:GspH/FimT family pseudopilin n=1 Tax=Marinobacterium arenosum TaxID=2862496 RepID=UPI001C96140E|nr:GspH/FimT family pseudopilin [Marinobacterium arenosum]MBY4678551.1 GspH/FimT family pseudopilin [Marinobacterium arenosum]